MVGLNETFYYNSCLCEDMRTSLENRTQALRALKTNIEKNWLLCSLVLLQPHESPVACRNV